MITEKRKVQRTNSHIVVEMNVDGEFPRYCGYIENLSQDGMGIISLDSFQTGTKLKISFVLPGSIDRVTTIANLVRAEANAGMLNYYAFTFENLSQNDCQKIMRYIKENAA